MPPTLAAARKTYSGRSFSKKASHVGLALQLQLGVRAQHEVGVAPRLQVAQDRGADEAAVAGDVDAGGGVHGVPFPPSR